MSHSNISFFVPHLGCPRSCAFCNQRTITSSSEAPHKEDVERVCTQALGEVNNPSNTEIAFFGGSFTAIERNYMLELLNAAQPFIGAGGFKGIRISTRPDCIDDEILRLLKEYGVTSIELGAQSMVDEVLDANDRGHTAKDVITASELIKSYGFELGLQVMVGLYRSSEACEKKTLDEVLKIHPDTIRIYPVCVLKGTRLAELYESGEYKLFSFERAIEICAEMVRAFLDNDIRILRIGLHASKDVEKNLVAGFYHPALGEIVKSAVVRDIIDKRLEPCDTEITVYAGKSMVSAAVGHKQSNKLYFCEKGIQLEIKSDTSLLPNEIRIKRDVYKCI